MPLIFKAILWIIAIVIILKVFGFVFGIVGGLLGFIFSWPGVIIIAIALILGYIFYNRKS